MLGHVCNQKESLSIRSNGNENDRNISVNIYNSNFGTWSQGQAPSSPSDIMDEHSYETVNLFKNLMFEGEEFVGEEFYSSLSENGQRNADNIGWFSHKINLYSYVNINEYQIGIPIDNYLLEDLSYLSIDSGVSYYIPAIKIDNDLVASFYVSGTSVRLVANNDQCINSLSQTYNFTTGSNYETNYVMQHFRTQYFVLNIDASKKKDIKSISCIDYVSSYLRRSDDSFFTYEFELGYIPTESVLNIPFLINHHLQSKYTISPYDLTYLNLSGGYADFSLGNSIYGELYGTNRQHMRLIGINFAVNYKGMSPELDGPGLLQFRTMYEDEYNDFVLDNSRAYDNSMVYLSRGRHSDEVGGEGSLINAYYCPRANLQYIDDSIISVSSMTFVKANQSNYLYSAYDPREYLTNNGVQYSTETIYFPCDISSYENVRGISYKYHYDPAVGKCSQQTLGINVSNEKVTTYSSSPVVYGLATLAYGWLGTLAVYVADAFVSGFLSSGKNIQRILFNLYDSKNQLIRNITQLQFAYQLGNHDPDYEDSDGNIYNLKPINGLNIKFITVGDSETLVSQISNFWRTESTQENGFMQCDEGHEYSMNGIKYSCYYQNIYNTKTRSDFMCYWSALSVWHVIDSGETERLTTNVDGYYLVYDEEDMNWHVVSIDNPDEDAGISVEDYLNGDTYGHSDGFEPPEDNDFDKKMKNLFSGLEDLGKWFLILNAVVLGIGLIGGVAYLIIRFGGFLGLGGSKSTTTINLNGVNSAKKNKPKKKKHKRKKGK